jgi:hypothetical protein
MKAKNEWGHAVLPAQPSENDCRNPAALAKIDLSVRSPKKQPMSGTPQEPATQPPSAFIPGG